MKELRSFEFIHPITKKKHTLRNRTPWVAAEKAARMLPVNFQCEIMLREKSRRWQERRRFYYRVENKLRDKTDKDPAWLPSKIKVAFVRSLGLKKCLGYEIDEQKNRRKGNTTDS